MAALTSIAVPCPNCGHGVDVPVTAATERRGAELVITVNAPEVTAALERELAECMGARIGRAP